MCYPANLTEQACPLWALFGLTLGWLLPGAWGCDGSVGGVAGVDAVGGGYYRVVDAWIGNPASATEPWVALVVLDGDTGLGVGGTPPP